MTIKEQYAGDCGFYVNTMITFGINRSGIDSGDWDCCRPMDFENWSDEKLNGLKKELDWLKEFIDNIIKNK